VEEARVEHERERQRREGEHGVLGAAVREHEPWGHRAGTRVAPPRVEQRLDGARPDRDVRVGDQEPLAAGPSRHAIDSSAEAEVLR
jgi:hypothetical protein